MSQPIAVKELSSSEKKRTKVGNRTTFEATFTTALAHEFAVRPADVQFLWIGKEAFAVRVEKLRADRTRHPLPASMDDQGYQPCPADAVIRGCVPKNCTVSSVVHAPCTSVSINHYHGSPWSQDRLERAVDGIRDHYRLFVS
jgi:hypothetical protein